MRRAARAVAVALLALASLAVWPFDRDEPADDERAYAEALRAAGEDRERGAAALARFLEEHPRSALADNAALRLAELAVEAGDAPGAEQRLVWALREHPKGDQAPRVRLRLAQLQARRGAWSDARQVAAAIDFAALELRERRDAHRLLADASARLRDLPGQLRWLAQLLADRPTAAEQREVEREIDTVVIGIPAGRLEEVAREIGPAPPAARLYLRAAELALAEGDTSRANTSVKAARMVPLVKSEADRLALLERRLATGEVLANDPAPLPSSAPPAAGGPLQATFGAVLPLSGSYAAFGEETLQGLLLATALLAPQQRPDGLRLLVRDSGGTAAGAEAAVESLAADPSVVAAFGPLVPEEQDAAARAAEAAGLPLLTFSRRDDADAGFAHVLQLAAPTRAEAALVAEYAVRTLGVRRFGILYPASDAGRQLRAEFWDAIDAAGGEVVAVASYEPTLADFGAPIRSLTGYRFVTPAAQAVLREREALRKRAKRLPPAEAAELLAKANALTPSDGSPLPPFVDFEALFIADVYSRAGLVAPHLAFQDVRGVRLLGTSTWDQRGLVGIGGRHVEGAVFATRYRGDRGELPVADFERRFREGFGRAPGYLAAQAFDAAGFALLAVARGYGRREGFVDGLRAVGGWHGVAADLRFRADGKLAHRPGLAAVVRGRIVALDERALPEAAAPLAQEAPAAEPAAPPAP